MNCVTPAFMLPLMDQSGPTSAFLDSDLSADVRLTFSLRLLVQRATLTHLLWAQLNERELAEVDNLMVCHTSTGAVLAMDREAVSTTPHAAIVRASSAELSGVVAQTRAANEKRGAARL